jgi:hypothetical protein
MSMDNNAYLNQFTVSKSGTVDLGPATGGFDSITVSIELVCLPGKGFDTASFIEVNHWTESAVSDALAFVSGTDECQNSVDVTSVRVSMTRRHDLRPFTGKYGAVKPSFSFVITPNGESVLRIVTEAVELQRALILQDIATHDTRPGIVRAAEARQPQFPAWFTAANFDLETSF